MKKIVLSTLFIATLSFVFTSCLKDKGFENGEYGINDPDTQPPGVGFPLGTNAKNGFGLDVTGSSQDVTGLVFVNLQSGNPAPSDISITLENKTAEMVAAYNAANGTSIEVLDPSLYSVPLTLTIPAGARNVQVPIVVPSTLTLDPNKSYGVGLRITGVSGNYLIADNMKSLFIEISIKNKYDGRYNLTGYHNRVPYTYPYETTMHMITSGPNAVLFYWPLVGSEGHPIGIGPNNALSWYGTAVRPEVVFDLSTNLVTNVFNRDGAVPITLFTGPGSRLSQWRPSDRSMTVDWNYSNNPLRAFFDDLEYLGPR